MTEALGPGVTHAGGEVMVSGLISVRDSRRQPRCQSLELIWMRSKSRVPRM
jgi:hypothetical protein